RAPAASGTADQRLAARPLARRTLWARSFRIDPGFLEALRPGAELALGKGAQLLRRRAREREALLVDLLADRRPGDDRVQLLADALRDVLRHVRRPVHRGEELDVDRRHAGLHRGRH